MILFDVISYAPKIAKTISKCELLKKVVMLPFKKGFALFPLLHANESTRY